MCFALFGSAMMFPVMVCFMFSDVSATTESWSWTDALTPLWLLAFLVFVLPMCRCVTLRAPE